MKRGALLAGSLLIVVLVVGLLFLVDRRDSILNASAPNILGIVEHSLAKHYQDPVMVDSLHHEFLAIHEKVRTGRADPRQMRKLVVTFYQCYEDGRIDSAEAQVIMAKVAVLAR
jgi:hypothetical protein